MEYYATFSIIRDGLGLMGVRDETFEAEDLADLKAQINEFYEENDTKKTTHLLDEIYDENGNEIDFREEN